MRNKGLHKFMFVVTLGAPVIGWLAAAKKYKLVQLTQPKIKGFVNLIPETPEHIQLMLYPAGFFIAAVLMWIIFAKLAKDAFTGAEFKEFLRGTKIVSPEELIRKTKEKVKQILVAGIPMPVSAENLHILINGTTNAGKSIVIRVIVYCALLRGDRVIIADNNGDLYSKFGRPNDKILNPHDIRTQKWVFHNEVRKDYDYEKFAKSIIPISADKSSEEWCEYARLLLVECAKKLAALGDTSISSLHRLATVEEVDSLRAFLAGSPAEALFVEGAERALGSARFVLSKYLPAHLKMPEGNFSLRDWLEDPDAGNLYITWREDMRESVKPLISAWLDILCSSLLSMPENRLRRIWMVIDELGSFEAMASLIDALTKGRRSGLCVVAGIQSVTQLAETYGDKAATILRSCFRTLVVMACAKSDPNTAEEMSKALGEHDVIRDKENVTHAQKGSSTNSGDEVVTGERVVMPSEIMSLPDRTAYVSFPGDLPICRVQFPFADFKKVNEAIQE